LVHRGEMHLDLDWLHPHGLLVEMLWAIERTEAWELLQVEPGFAAQYMTHWEHAQLLLSESWRGVVRVDRWGCGVPRVVLKRRLKAVFSEKYLLGPKLLLSQCLQTGSTWRPRRHCVQPTTDGGQLIIKH
jgi:hypothetical protein